MIAYADTSVVLRYILGESGIYPNLEKLERIYSSELMRVEALRALDRLRIQAGWPIQETALRIQLLHSFLSSVEEIPLQKSILQRAADPFPTVVKTLDALHIASASLLKMHLKKSVLFLTHDAQQGLAATAADLDAKGF